MVENEQAYTQVINKIIEGQVNLLGALAVAKAKSVPGLELNDSGEVTTISGSPQIIIHNLLLKYEEIAGKAATLTSKVMLTELKKNNPGLELPQKLM